MRLYVGIVGIVGKPNQGQRNWNWNWIGVFFPVVHIMEVEEGGGEGGVVDKRFFSSFFFPKTKFRKEKKKKDPSPPWIGVYHCHDHHQSSLCYYIYHFLHTSGVCMYLVGGFFYIY